jgi:hypothetical protein
VIAAKQLPAAMALCPRRSGADAHRETFLVSESRARYQFCPAPANQGRRNWLRMGRSP